ncbi:hypothetical protein Pcinc_003284 [Petrolisthes cinctipes]|uniref:HAT C-terminal dimerisation domain-containing protein n=1 Tax=Petrolisthes cinctipes TaxID=88211 RepID=A0AAE1L263_PETCI|nr:hypothetical protein Pcinc_003284 [Petrolisthes cinctipes]
MLIHFYELRDEVKQFMEIKGTPVKELSDTKWLCDLAFMVDITKYLSELNVKLQGHNQLLSSLLSNVQGQQELNIFTTPFNVESVDVPDNLQHEIIQLQSDDELKARCNNLSLLEFYRRYVSADDFPILRRHALKYASVFGTTYCCEQFLSKLTLAKCRLRSRLTDANLKNLLRVASSTIPLNITRLAKEKQLQPSHWR